MLLHRRQNKPSEEDVQKLHHEIKKSTESVIEVQLAIDEADRSKSLALGDARETNSHSAYDLRTQLRSAMRDVSRGDKLIENIPTFKALSVTEHSRPSAAVQSARDEIIYRNRQPAMEERYNKIQQQAPFIVQNLLLSWTKVSNEYSSGPSAESIRDGARKEKSGAFSPIDLVGDEPAARISSYNKCTSRKSPNAPHPSSCDDPRRSQNFPSPSAVRNCRGGESARGTRSDAAAPVENYESEKPSPVPSIVGDTDDELRVKIPALCQQISLYFPPFSISDGLLTVSEVRRKFESLGFIQSSGKIWFFYYKGRILRLLHIFEDTPIRAFGVKHRSTIDALSLKEMAVEQFCWGICHELNKER